MRGTEGQDTSTATQSAWHKHRWLPIALAAALGAIVLIWLVRAWFDPAGTVAAERLRIATVSKGHFVRDVAAEGTVIAAITLPHAGEGLRN